MKRYAYYPGCSLDGTGAPVGESVPPVARTLDIDLVELENWTCCGSRPFGGTDLMGAVCIASRNLALAEKTGLDLVVPCSSCYVILSEARALFHDNPTVRAKVIDALGSVELKYAGNTQVRHLVDVLFNDLGLEALSSRVRRKLTGLKVACYYGCQQTRPRYNRDDPELPTWLDSLVASLGAEAVDFPLKARCCGGTTVIYEDDIAIELMHRLLENASDNGAQCIVTTTCPLCHTNLDAYQSRVNRRYKTKFNLPILAVTQLIGVAIGMAPRLLGLDKNIVPPARVLAQYL